VNHLNDPFKLSYLSSLLPSHYLGRNLVDIKITFSGFVTKTLMGELYSLHYLQTSFQLAYIDFKGGTFSYFVGETERAQSKGTSISLVLKIQIM